MEQYYIIPKTTIDDIEDSIQRKRGSEAPIEPSEMPLAIDTIPSSVDGTDVPVGGIYLTKPDSNGNPTEAYIIGYAPVVNYTWTNILGGAYFPYLRKVEFINTSNIISIENWAFQNCSSLTTISLPDSVTSIGTEAFRSCSSLTTISLPDSLTSIGSSAFQNCASLTSISLPDSLTSIGGWAFQYCTSLTTIKLPNSLTSIGSAAFGYCTSLTTIKLPNSLTSIGSAAFGGCTSLTTIKLPNSLTSIGSAAFGGCSSLENVTIENGFNCNNLNISPSTRYSVETMVSWFEALADRTGQAPFTLTIGSTNLNKLTAEQKAIATNKNWTLA